MQGARLVSNPYSRYCRGALLFIVGKRVNQRAAENSGRRARYTRAMHQNNQSLGRRKRRRRGEERERETGAAGERETKDSRHLRTYKHAPRAHTYKHTRARTRRREERETKRDRERERRRERSNERTASSSSSSSRHGRRSRNRGTTTPVEASPLLPVELRLRANYDALLRGGKRRRGAERSGPRTKSSRARNESESTRGVATRRDREEHVSFRGTPPRGREGGGGRRVKKECSFAEYAAYHRVLLLLLRSSRGGGGALFTDRQPVSRVSGLFLSLSFFFFSF